MKIVIVGGGTIGWLTTFVMSKIRPKHQYINITSSNIPTIGVGEGIDDLRTFNSSDFIDALFSQDEDDA